MGSPSDAKRAVMRDPSSPAAKRGWLGRRAWQDIRRASSIAAADGAYSVEVHGVRIVYRRQTTSNLQEPSKSKPARASVREQAPASGSERNAQQPTNSRQRRSRARLLAYNASKQQRATAVAMEEDVVAADDVAAGAEEMH